MDVLFANSLSQPPPLSVLPSLAGMIFVELSPPVVISAVLASIFVLGMVLRGTFFLNRRREEMRGAALRLGLRPWPDNSLPRGLSLQATPFFRPTKLTNIYEGLLSHNEVVIFDVHKEEVDSRWARTVIAVKTTSQVGIPANLESRKAGAWQLIYSPVGLCDNKELLDAERLESIVKNVAR